jgi:DNA-binding transcriptional LysR family regulator
MDYLRDLALFVEVAKARSFTRAAATLGVPTSSLSRRVAELEASVGVALFNRTTRRVDLTEAGAVYLAQCERIVDAAREAHDQVRGLVQTPQGLLRISGEADLAPRLIAPAVAEFMRLYPAVRLELDLSPRRVDLVAENFDLAIRLGQLPDSALTVRRLALLGVNLYASPEYLQRAGTPLEPSDLRSHARIHLLHQGDRGEWKLAKSNETVTIEAGASLSANNMTMIRQLASLGLGVAVLDDIMAREDIGSGALQPVLPDWTLQPIAVSVLTPARLLPAKTRKFIDLLAGRVSGLLEAPARTRS